MKNFIKLCVVCVIMMMGMASCCAPSSDNGSQGTTQTADNRRIPNDLISVGTITDVEVVHKHVSDFCINFIAFRYNGHRYIKYSDSSTLLHSPDCDCQDESSSSLLFDKPSSIFDW